MPANAPKCETEFKERNKALEFVMVLLDNLYSHHHHARAVLVSYIMLPLWLYHSHGYICHAN